MQTFQPCTFANIMVPSYAQSNPSDSFWRIDSRPSRNMIKICDILFSLNAIALIFIGLPNGSRT